MHKGLITLVLGLTLGSLTACDLIRTPEECDADLGAMQGAVAETLASASSCRTDSDCVLYNPSNLCFESCPVAINGLDLGRVDQEIVDAERSYCLGFAEQCGGSSDSALTCADLNPMCVQGSCQLRDPLDLP